MTDKAAEDVSPMTTERGAQYLTERGLPMSGRTLRRLVDRGEIAAIRTPGGQRLLRRSALDNYVQRVK